MSEATDIIPKMSCTELIRYEDSLFRSEFEIASESNRRVPISPSPEVDLPVRVFRRGNQ